MSRRREAEFEIRFNPIGVVHTSSSREEVKSSFDGVDGWIEIYREYEDGLEGLDGYSHIIIIAFLHETTAEQRKVLRVKPRRLARLGIRLDDIPEVGVFSTDSPHRPNPIALSIVELLERRGRTLFVRGLDLFDGTPVLDIKPYTYDRRITCIRVPEWYQILVNRVKDFLDREIPYRTFKSRHATGQIYNIVELPCRNP